ncbi:hypothetical protein MUK42_35296 [Musa troglodytarum]|uniref:Uncharacterized protein n=1 Tax=Musa troglodytarum TaxID=320322 RepID=A0A9E7EBL3_9LILI|nr:hypothetical protein MUK42_35296 [Musa troglodytarum]
MKLGTKESLPEKHGVGMLFLMPPIISSRLPLSMVGCPTILEEEQTACPSQAMREEKGDDKTGFCERLLCCICVAVKTAAEGEFPQEKSIYQPPKKQSSGTKKTEDSQGTKGSDDQPPRPIGTFNMTLHSREAIRVDDNIEGTYYS